MTKINAKSIKIVNSAKKLYKQQIVLCEKFMQENHGDGYDDFWNMVFDLDSPQKQTTKRRKSQ